MPTKIQAMKIPAPTIQAMHPRQEDQRRMTISDAAANAFSALLGERYVTARGIREQHRAFAGPDVKTAPDAVAFATSTEEVSQIVKICAQHKVPVIPFGIGTSMESHVAATRGGITIDLSRMDQVLEVSADDLDCTVQAGCTREALNHHIRDMGLMFPIDPGANATLGGMASTRASGTNAVRYGTMMQNVLCLKVVLPDGRIIKTGTRARKSAAGYDLTRLFVGAEGTLGIITEVTLRLYGIPEAISAAICAFPDLEKAVNTVILTIQSGIPVARMELMDELMVKGVNAHSKLGLEETPTLVMEFHGSNESVQEQARSVQDIAEELGGSNFQWATRPEDRSRIWKARHEAYFACLAMRPGSILYGTDAAVPISRLVDVILETRADVEEHGVLGPIIGHVGDGNFHCSLMVDPENAEEMEVAEKLAQRISDRAQRMGGTCTGEHGIGLGKREKLVKELGPDAIDVMRTLKAALDPHNIMNPDKIFLN
jgi:D-lactate dehydrogenase (cytochrome)